MSVNPYAGKLEGRDPLAVMAETPALLAKVVRNMSREQTEERSAAGKWNVREVVAHLADCEIAFGFRLRQAFGGERMIQPFDQDAWAKSYASYSMDLALATFTALRAWNVAFVGGLSEADKQRVAWHPERGEMVLWAIAETMAGHDVHHLAGLEAMPEKKS